jgi:hypothetical protein
MSYSKQCLLSIVLFFALPQGAHSENSSSRQYKVVSITKSDDGTISGFCYFQGCPQKLTHISKKEAIEKIESGALSFFVTNKNDLSPIKVIIAKRLGKKYLKTVSDKTEENNLLSLPQCSH